MSLDQVWRQRNSAAEALAGSEREMRAAVRAANVNELIALLETFSPARSAGPDWTRSFEPLIERLWAWCDDTTMAALADNFRARGMPWLAVANALSPGQGARLRADVRHPAWARLPAFALA